MNACNKQRIAVWNCNAILWSNLGSFSGTYTDRNIIFYTETHESQDRRLPTINGFTWESAHRRETERDTRIPDYSAHLAFLHRHIDTVPSLDHRAALITHSLHDAARHIFPSTTRSTRPLPAGSTPCNSWYDDECKALCRTL